MLLLEGGDFFAGYTRDIRVRLMDHQGGIGHATAGRSPKLVWFTMVESRTQTESLRMRVRRLCRDDPREVRRWILRLRDLVKDLDLL